MSDAPATAVLGDRSLFPDLEARAYLNHAAISPASRVTQERAAACLADYGRDGLGGFKAWQPRREALKETLAALMGARAEDLGLVLNTSTGVTDIALGLDWSPGDRVLVFDGDFPANVTPWQTAARAFGLTLEVLPTEAFHRSHEEGLAALEKHLAGARLLAVSWVRFQTGFRMPLEALGARCRAHGAELFVDGIQGLGVVPLDVRAAGVDYLASGGHKWLMGPEGAGLLYVAPERQAALVPRTAGWLSHEDALDFLFLGPGHLRRDRPLKATADVFERGAGNALGYAALEGSVELLAQLGTEAIFAHVQRYLDALEPGLVARGFTSLRSADAAARSGSLCVGAPEGIDAPALQHALGERGVACAVPCGNLRFAPHWPNALTEVPIVLGAIDDAVRVLRG
ncbi:MAG: aminotransferase class V-fold PLP-dependent enzyme, partial [Myxococcota bacterium]